MKNNLILPFIAVAGIAVLSGCQTNPRTDSRSSGPKISDKAAQLAFQQNPNGTSSNRDCERSLSQLGIDSNSRSFHEAWRPCQDALDDLRSKKNNQDLANLQRQRQYEQQQAQDAFNQRITAIRAGRAKVQTAQEAAVIYNAADGMSISQHPLVKADGRLYVIKGHIDPAGGSESGNLIIKTGEAIIVSGELISPPSYAYIKVASTIPPNARAESSVEIVGTYSGNRDYATGMGTRRTMPIITSKFIQTF